MQGNPEFDQMPNLCETYIPAQADATEHIKYSFWMDTFIITLL